MLEILLSSPICAFGVTVNWKHLLYRIDINDYRDTAVLYLLSLITLHSVHKSIWCYVNPR